MDVNLLLGTEQGENEFNTLNEQKDTHQTGTQCIDELYWRASWNKQSPYVSNTKKKTNLKQKTKQKMYLHAAVTHLKGKKL